MLEGIIDSTVSNNVRQAIVILVHILNAELEKKQWNGLSDYADLKVSQATGNKLRFNVVRDVNKMFGWAIYNLRLGKIEEKKSAVEGSEKEEKLVKQIEFLSHLRIYAEEAMEQKEYLDKYYDSFMRSSNRGYMTLVSIKYFDFGSQLITKVTETLNQRKLKNNLDATEKGKKLIMNDQDLLNCFLTASQDNVHMESKVDQTTMFKLLVDKVINTRFSEEFWAYKEEYTVRGGKNKLNNLTLRGQLDSYGKRKKKKKDVEDLEQVGK